MQVNDELVDKLAKLSRLRFGHEEKEEIKEDLQKMIAFVEKLKELDLSDVEPMIHISSQKNIFREDKVSGMLEPEDALKNAPEKDGQFFVVPKMIRRPAE